MNEVVIRLKYLDILVIGSAGEMHRCGCTGGLTEGGDLNRKTQQ